MPRIIISEKENEVMSLLNPTENVVLVPLVCKHSAEEGADKAIYYRADELAKFRSEFSTRVVGITGGSTQSEKSYYYIKALLGYGLSVVVKPILVAEGKTECTEAEVDTYVNEGITAGAFEEFKDKNNFNLKFITTGAHANVLKTATAGTIAGCYDTLAAIAKERGDCIALMDLEEDIVCETNSSNPKDIKNVLKGDEQLQSEEYKYAACIFPWCSFKLGEYSNITMPGGFAYLSAFANSTQTNADWYAAAGVNRGAIPNLNSPLCEIGESQMHILLNENETGSKVKFNVNPIMKVSEYGSKIWGNRVACVMSSSEAYQSFLNVRILLCNIRKQIYYAATRVTFEPNDMITWLNFQQLANTLLDDMQANRGIEWYSWRRQATKDKATIKAILTIKPIEAVEYFDILVNLTSEEAEVAEI